MQLAMILVDHSVGTANRLLAIGTCSLTHAFRATGFGYPAFAALCAVVSEAGIYRKKYYVNSILANIITKF